MEYYFDKYYIFTIFILFSYTYSLVHFYLTSPIFLGACLLIRSVSFHFGTLVFSYKIADVLFRFENSATTLYLRRINSLRKTADFLGLSKSSIHRWLSSSPLVRRRKVIKKTTDAILKFMQSKVTDNTHITLKTLKQSINETSHVELSAGCIHVNAKKLGFTRKRTTTFVSSDSTEAKIETFRNQIQHIDISEVVLINETYFEVSMLPTVRVYKEGH